MECIRETKDSLKSLPFRHILILSDKLSMITVTFLYVIWGAWIYVLGNESPFVTVRSKSMEPALRRWDLVFMHMSKEPIRVGEIVVFNVDGRGRGEEILHVHRVIEVHKCKFTGEVYILTKGDNNNYTDRVLYPKGQLWLQQHHIVGRAVWNLPYVGWCMMYMNPIILVGELGLFGLILKHWKVRA